MDVRDVQPDADSLQATVILRYRPPLCCRSAQFVIDHNRDHFPISLLDETSEAEIKDAIGEINRMLKMTSAFRWRLWPVTFLVIIAVLASISIGFILYDDASVGDMMPWLTHDNIITVAVLTVVAIVLVLLYISCVVQLRNALKMQGIGQVLWYLNNRFVGRLFWQLSTDSNQRPIIVIKEASAAYVIGSDPAMSNPNEYVPIPANADTERHQVAIRMTSTGCRQQ